MWQPTNSSAWGCSGLWGVLKGGGEGREGGRVTLYSGSISSSISLPVRVRTLGLG